MDFRTRVPLSKSDNLIEHSSGILLIGSCFVENIGDKLEWFKFRNLQNPFGIIFHPAPIFNLLERISEKRYFAEDELIHFNSNWLSLEAHSSMNAESREKCLYNLNNAMDKSLECLQSSGYVVISLGTAWYYSSNATGNEVANCHKIPQKEFSKNLSSPLEIEKILENIRKTLNKINEDLKIIYTVSPVRHLKDGFIENQQSKANLITALHNYLSKDPKSSYFPSYEIMMDELRDYRFYKRDMLHPNELAIDYIWELFSENWMSKNALELNKEINKIQKGLQHRSHAENSVEHKKFLTKIQNKIEEIQIKYPEITFS